MKNYIKKIPWFIVAFILIAISGVPIAFYTGSVLAKIEHTALTNKRFIKNASEVNAFEKIFISGAGLNVQIICGDKLEIFQENENDQETFFIQRKDEFLHIYYQKINQANKNDLIISIPNQLFKIDVKNGATVSAAECAINPNHLTIDLAGGATLAASGTIKDLFLFGATGSKLIKGPQGYLNVEQAIVNMVINSYAELCGVGYITGNTNVGAKLKVSKDVIIDKIKNVNSIEFECTEGLISKDALPNA